MKETGILFKAPMVRAILNGQKTQTRRIVKPQPFIDPKWGLTWEPRGHAPNKPSYCERNANWNPITNAMLDFGSPYGGPGDLLWIKETHARVHPGMLQSLDPDPDSPLWETVYRADTHGGYVESLLRCTKWRPSILMPRRFSRITLEIVAVRVERLQDITEGDAIAEGCEMEGRFPKEQPDPSGIGEVGWDSAVEWYSWLWESINGPGSWDLNPWVWVIEFRRVNP